MLITSTRFFGTFEGKKFGTSNSFFVRKPLLLLG
jgi:hypothetical protein